MKILYCTDFSESSLYSLERAFAFLKPGSKMDIISVIELEFLIYLGEHPSTYIEYLELCKENKVKELEKIRPALEEKNIVIDKSLFPDGNTADEILLQLKKENYSLVITGSRTKKLFSKLLGSVSRKIAEKSHVPVFFARKKKDEKISKEQKRALFAVDGTENSYNSVKKAIDILDFKCSATEILYVKKSREAFPPEIATDRQWMETILRKEQELAAEIVERASDIAEKSGVKVAERTILEGSPAEKILEYTEKHEKELIIMGSHGREGISSLLLGSVSKVIADHTYCPVIIIPTKTYK